MSRQDRDDRRIVVGVDGSPSSMAALRWAVLQAELTGCAVEAVTAWRLPSRYGFAVVTDRATDFEGRCAQDPRRCAERGKQRRARCGHPLIRRGGASRRSAGPGRTRGGHAGGGQPGTWRIHRGGARLGQPVLRASCPLSCPGHPRDRLGRPMTSTVVNSKTVSHQYTPDALRRQWELERQELPGAHRQLLLVHPAGPAAIATPPCGPRRPRGSSVISSRRS